MAFGINPVAPSDLSIGAGALNRRVSFQSPVDVADGEGGTTRTWQTVFSTYAYMEPYKGWEKWDAQQVYPNLITRVLIRYRPSQNITPIMRMLYGSKVYNVRAAYDKGAGRRTVEILAEELQATGSNA